MSEYVSDYEEGSVDEAGPGMTEGKVKCEGMRRRKQVRNDETQERRLEVSEEWKK